MPPHDVPASSPYAYKTHGPLVLAHSIILEMNTDSYRRKSAEAKQASP